MKDKSTYYQDHRGLLEEKVELETDSLKIVMLQADQCLRSYFLDSRNEFDSWVKTHESEASAHPSHSRQTLRVFQLLKTSEETTEKNGEKELRQAQHLQM